jgi:homoserine O-succinyltransferase
MSLTALFPDRLAGAKGPTAGRARLVVGLVNNMPDSALRATERQFCELLAAAAGNREVSLRFFALPDVPRGEAGQAHIAAYYADVDELRASGVDGLIVTGTEPRAADLSGEPYWSALTALIDWAERNTISTVWSCLAAHAAVLHLDGIERQPYGHKLSGVFECAKVADHPLLRDMPSTWHMPHSRYNDLSEASLVAAGYRPLARSAEAGIDLFARERASLFVFLQGHPEYDSGALYREYRRDVGRFLARERDDYPAMPESCFDDRLAAAFDAFREQALRDRAVAAFDAFPAAGELAHPWKQPARRFYAGWLNYLAEAQAARRRPMPRRTRVAV